jgi:acrylyl-CoA reductase (NADPH)
MAKRKVAWDALAKDFDVGKLDALTRVIGLGDVFEAAEEILTGRLRGRTVVDVNRLD